MTADTTTPSTGSGRTPMISMVVIRVWIDALVRRGGRASTLRQLGLTETMLRRWDTFVDPDLHHRVVGWAVGEHGACAGLLAAARVPRGAFALLEYAARTAPDLRNGGRHLLRCDRLFGRRGLALHEHGHRTTIRDESADVAESSTECAVVELMFGALAAIGRDALGGAWQPSAVRFTHAATGTPRKYGDVFGCGAEHLAMQTELEIPTATLDAPLRGADPRLHSLLLDSGAQFLRRLDGDAFVSHSVRRVLRDAIRTGRVSLPRIADELGMTRRTLQNRLAREGTSLSVLVDRVRQDLAEQYLARPGVGISEVAAALGYSEPSAFRRAFKRWTGTTPNRFRQSRG